MRVHSTQHAARSSSASFSHGAGKAVSLAGIAAREIPVDKNLVKLGANLENITVPAGPNATTSPLPIALAAFRLEPKALASVFADKHQTQNFVRAALVSSTGGEPEGYDRRYERLKIGAGQPGKIIPTLLKFDDGEIVADMDAKTKSKVTSDVRDLARAFLHGAGDKLYSFHWDNRDDTDYDGFMAVDRARGEVRFVFVDNH
jgi:hypothetical protein